MIEFIWALGAIILIDVVLGGENALVIAMAAKKLPEHLRRRAMIWGTFGAVAVRFLCVAALTYLLMIPGLRLVGGLLLIWIAWRLTSSGDEHNDVKASDTFWGAMGTIVMADAVMGLDNALAIAGAAGGNSTNPTAGPGGVGSPIAPTFFGPTAPSYGTTGPAPGRYFAGGGGGGTGGSNSGSVNATAGTATLSSGTITVSTNAVTASSIILLTRQDIGASTALGELTVANVVATTSFDIVAATPATPGTPLAAGIS